MLDISIIENLAGKTFKILNGFPSYVTIEQKEKPSGIILVQDIFWVIAEMEREGT